MEYPDQADIHRDLPFTPSFQIYGSRALNVPLAGAQTLARDIMKARMAGTYLDGKTAGSIERVETDDSGFRLMRSLP